MFDISKAALLAAALCLSAAPTLAQDAGNPTLELEAPDTPAGPDEGHSDVPSFDMKVEVPVITALGLLTFWAATGFYGQPATAVISHAIFFVTLPLVTLSLGFSSIDRSLVEAAATMGADDRTVFRTVVLPLILPYLISGYAFAFVLSLNEYIVAYMTIGFTMETLPIKIFNALRYGYTPTMASVTILFVAIAATIFGLVARFGDLPKLLGAMSSRD